MLYEQTVSPGMLILLKSLMSLPELSLFRLVGGTSLSLQLGHRISIDLDFFTEKSFDVNNTINVINNGNEPFELQSVSRTGFACIIQNIKCDFYNWGVPFIREPLIIEQVRLCSLEDITAFKLDAIIKRKEKKDFWDIEALLSLFSLKNMFGYYKEKYIYNDIKIVIDALSEIDLADDSQEPIIIKNKSWNEVKDNIKRSWKDFQSESLNRKEQERLDRIQNAENLLKNRNKKE